MICNRNKRTSTGDEILSGFKDAAHARIGKTVFYDIPILARGKPVNFRNLFYAKKPRRISPQEVKAGRPEGAAKPFPQLEKPDFQFCMD
jgi:hypothetical protein